MKRCRLVFPGVAALGLSLVANSTTAAEYQGAPAAVQTGAPLAADTNQALLRPGEIELKIQFRLLSALAQEHRQRAEAANRAEQGPRAAWETDLAEELRNRGSNILVQLEKGAAQRQTLLSGSAPEGGGPLSPAEIDYLGQIQQRLQAIQQEMDSATEETRAYALQAATNRDTTVYGDTTVSLRLQEIGRDIKRLRAEQASLELQTSQFWALRALIRGAQNVTPPQTNAAP